LKRETVSIKLIMGSASDNIVKEERMKLKEAKKNEHERD
jgi:phosphoribosylcarboxyaminoimidazole (NCAIR) mutase